MKDPDSRKKKTADLEELRTVLPHPYITGQGLSREKEETNPPSDSPSPDCESPSD